MFVWGAPKITARFNDMLREITGLSILSYFTAMIYYSQRHKAKLAKKKVSTDKVQKKPHASFQDSSPCGVTQDTLNSSNNEL